MCINEETSWITLILGTVINTYVVKDLYRNRIYLPIFIILAWQYALLMQIPDAIAWRNIKNGNSTEHEGKLAFFLNITQPIVWFLCIMPFVKSYNVLLPVLLLLGIYIYDIYNNKLKYDITPPEKCNSLNYQWWEKLNPYLYFLVMTSIFMIIPDRKFALLNIILFYGSFIISKLIKYECNFGSFWCWSIASCGLINYLAA